MEFWKENLPFSLVGLFKCYVIGISVGQDALAADDTGDQLTRPFKHLLN